MITNQELQEFKRELLEEFKKLLSQGQPFQSQRWLKSHQVRRMLAISPGTLQQMRVSRALPFTKIGGVMFYDANDIEKMIVERKQNSNTDKVENAIR